MCAWPVCGMTFNLFGAIRWQQVNRKAKVGYGDLCLREIDLSGTLFRKCYCMLPCRFVICLVSGKLDIELYLLSRIVVISSLILFSVSCIIYFNFIDFVATFPHFKIHLKKYHLTAKIDLVNFLKVVLFDIEKLMLNCFNFIWCCLKIIKTRKWINLTNLFWWKFSTHAMCLCINHKIRYFLNILNKYPFRYTLGKIDG